MQAVSIFDNIEKVSQERMICCFKARKKRFLSGETIMTYSDKLNKIGIVVSGKARLFCVDEDGEYSLLDTIGEGEVFGEMLTLPISLFEYIVEADKDTEVLFIDYNHIVKTCENACEHHCQLINNLFHMIAQKAQTLAFRVNLLSQKNVRRKLVTYFEYLSEKTGSKEFDLDLTLVSLAQYLNVDRSSLMREIRRMKAEGLLMSNGRHIKMLTENI